jgi:hypothetical protein
VSGRFILAKVLFVVFGAAQQIKVSGRFGTPWIKLSSYSLKLPQIEILNVGYLEYCNYSNNK